eukprot:TRINITY_DN27483_c0_g1_i2.p1 TRINITY_DN27483_c0_g1~~TRINITY_DN27483_c0_g1_i2.p1  ORF type:complete len:290 (-),score=46.70 TRINITY_DN27483_c0_g1_i2:82-951(-)
MIQKFFQPIFYILVRLWHNLIHFIFPDDTKTVFVAETNLPTHSGTYRVRAYRTLGSAQSNTTATSASAAKNKGASILGAQGGAEPLAIISGKVEGAKNVPVRVHDQCFTSEVLGSKKCDCKEQLDYAMEYIRDDHGIVIYLQQEGRGIGLANKIAAYSLQEVYGYDTVDANRMLGLPDDTRDYQAVYDILKDLNVQSVVLMTNNPRKIQQLQTLGINISRRMDIHIKPNEVNVEYMKTKAARMQHLFIPEKLIVQEQSEVETDETILASSPCVPTAADKPLALHEVATN